MKLTMEEKSITAIYAAPTLQETLERMAETPIQEMEPEIQADFLSAMKKLKAMDEQAYRALDMRDVLLTDADELREVEENAGTD